MPDVNHSPEPWTERGASRGAGGTPGGFGSFFVGLGMMLVGSYLILNQAVEFLDSSDRSAERCHRS